MQTRLPAAVDHMMVAALRWVRDAEPHWQQVDLDQCSEAESRAWWGLVKRGAIRSRDAVIIRHRSKPGSLRVVFEFTGPVSDPDIFGMLEGFFQKHWAGWLGRKPKTADMLSQTVQRDMRLTNEGAEIHGDLANGGERLFCIWWESGIPAAGVAELTPTEAVAFKPSEGDGWGEDGKSRSSAQAIAAMKVEFTNDYRDLTDAVRGLNDTLAGRQAQSEGSPDSSGTARTGEQNPTADDLMKAALATDFELVKGFTRKQWAQHIGKSQSAVQKAATWQELVLLREKHKAEHMRDRSRR